MKLNLKFNKIFIIFILCFCFIISLFTIYKELQYYNNLELLTQNLSTIQLQQAKNKLQSITNENNLSQNNQKLQDEGILKVLNISQVDNDLTKKIKTEVTNLASEEDKITQELKNLQQQIKDIITKNGLETGAKTMAVASQATSHLKPITDSINQHLESLSSEPPDHLVNHPSLPNYDPKKANSWWMPQGNTQQFFSGNYIPIAPTNCTQTQCQPDGFAQGN